MSCDDLPCKFISSSSCTSRLCYVMPQEPVSNRKNFCEGALWLLFPGLLGRVAGDWAEETAEKAGIGESLIETHEALAFATLGILRVLL